MLRNFNTRKPDNWKVREWGCRQYVEPRRYEYVPPCQTLYFDEQGRKISAEQFAASLNHQSPVAAFFYRLFENREVIA